MGWRSMEWWNNDVNAEVKRKEFLEARYEDGKQRCQEVYKEEKRNVKRCIYHSKKEVHGQFGRRLR